PEGSEGYRGLSDVLNSHNNEGRPSPESVAPRLPPAMSLSDRWSGALSTLKAQGRYRGFAPPRGIDLASNDYLGYGAGRLGGDATAAPAGLARTGLASRLLRGHHPVWEEVESALAAWHGAEAVLMMTSGYAANEGLLSTVIEPSDWVATDELN